jgi:hypothetical protein
MTEMNSVFLGDATLPCPHKVEPAEAGATAPIGGDVAGETASAADEGADDALDGDKTVRLIRAR